MRLEITAALPSCLMTFAFPFSRPGSVSRPKSAKTVNTKYEEVQSGPVCGYFRAATDWITHEGAKAAEDVREVTIYDVADGRLMDFVVTVKATNGALEFQDTKEGMFGLRVP